MRATLFVLLVVWGCLSIPVPAQVFVHVPDNTYSTLGNVIPMAGKWPPYQNPGGEWRYQLHVPSAMIGRSGVIKDIAFLSCKNQTLDVDRMEVRMSHTPHDRPLPDFDQNLPSPWVVLPAKRHAWAGYPPPEPTPPLPPPAPRWSPLELERSFYYNGVDNLTIELRYVTGNAQGCSESGACESSPDPRGPFRSFAWGSGAYSRRVPDVTGDARGLKVRLTMEEAGLEGSGLSYIGKTKMLHLQSTADAGLAYQVASSYGEGPTTWNGRKIYLDFDSLFYESTRLQPSPMFVNYRGTLDAYGRADAYVDIPDESRLIGMQIHSAFWTLDPSSKYGIGSISNTYTITISKSTQAALLDGSGSTTLGSEFKFQLEDPGNHHQDYRLISSWGTGPTTLLGKTVYLSYDDLFKLTLYNYVPSVYRNYQGRLDGNGKANASVVITKDPRYVGMQVHSAFLVWYYGPYFPTIKSVSNTFSFTITR
jgi:hypothetical protein